MNLYIQLGSELHKIFDLLDEPREEAIVLDMMRDVVKKAHLLNPHIHEQALRLQEEIHRYFETPGNRRNAASMRRDALKISQETREL